MSYDLHTHTVFSDGDNTPEEMVKAALEKGFSAIGISDHCYTFFDESYCLQKDKIEEYKSCVRALKEKYRGRIEVLLGIEQDYEATAPTDDYDYVIGSVHYLKTSHGFVPVDENKEIFQRMIKEDFDGDVYALCEAYFASVADLYNRTHCDIIGHFDLVKRYNGDGSLFDEDHPRYLAAAQKALDALLPAGVPFEINLGAYRSGARKDAYPADRWIRYILDHGGKVILSGDTHNAVLLGQGYEKFQKFV